MALPTVLIIVALVGLPSIQSLIYSFQKVKLTGEATWNGIDNYVNLLTSADFHHSFLLTSGYAICFLVLSTTLGLIFALILNEAFPGRGIARALLIIPWASPWLIVGVIWHWFTDGNLGSLNAALVQLGITDAYTPFLAQPTWAFVFSVLAASWRMASFVGLILLAALQTVPSELYEAARVDGANIWQRFRYVTFPWLQQALVVVIIMGTIFGFMQFDVIYGLTQGGPGNATSVLSILLYRQLFEFTNIGMGSAVAVVMAVVALSVGLLFVRLMYRTSSKMAMGS